MRTIREYRFVRRDDQRAIGGVASAIAVGLGLPVILGRILFVCSIFLGFGLPLYFLLWFLTPRLRVDGEFLSAANRVWTALLICLVPILFGIGIGAFHLAPVSSLLLAVGAATGGIMLRRGRSVGSIYLDEEVELPTPEQPAVPGGEPATMVEPVSYQSGGLPSTPPAVDTPRARLGGVCAWVAELTGVNVTVVRVAVIITTLIPPTFPLVPFLYGFAIFFVPRSERTPAHGG